ncbi:MAG: hypothetical protein ACOC4H_00445 [bacterium]
MNREVLEYEVSPRKLEKGNNDIMMRIRNKRAGKLKDVKVTLKAVDFDAITVIDPVKNFDHLNPGEEALLNFSVEAVSSSGLYAMVEANRRDRHITYDMPVLEEKLKNYSAAITGVRAQTGVYEPPGNKIFFDVHLKGYTDSNTLELACFVELPDGDVEIMDDVPVDRLEAGGEKTISLSIIPEIKGPHVIYAYLYDGDMLIDRGIEKIFVQDTGGRADDE